MLPDLGEGARSAEALPADPRASEVVGLRPVLLGRSGEKAVLDALLDGARGGRSGCLVLGGDAGVGKTALLGYCSSRATGFRLAKLAAVESEMELPFAALHQLCVPLLDHLDALPEAQQRALRVAFGLSFGDAPDRSRVALAVLSLTAEAAADRPLLCVVDDAQWLDAVSAQVLAFVARRLLAESVAIVFAMRPEEGGDELADLPSLAVGGLQPEEARALLDMEVAAPLDAHVRDRLILEARGNPLALLEFASAPEHATGGHPGPGPQELSGHIEQRFLDRLRGLDADARRLLLIAAAEPAGDADLLWRAAARLGLGLREVPPAAESLVRIGERVAFRHPLVRSAVYRAASPEDRRAVHLALAQVTDPRADGDRRAWHLAAAARGPDEAAASALEQSAGRAQARGGFAAAAALLQRSVALTRDPARRTARALAAAEASLHAGAFEDARTALAAAEAGALDPLQSAQAELLRGHIAFAAGFPADASALLLEAAGRLVPLDLALARETYLGACGAAIFAGPARAQDLADVGRAVRRLPPTADEPRATDVLLDGLASLVVDGRAAAAPVLLRATAAFAGDELPVEESLRWGWLATAGCNALWDDDGLREVCRRQIRLARDTGALEQLPIYLIALACATARGGDVATASGLVAEADAVVGTTGTKLAPFAAELLLASLRGSTSEVGALTSAAAEHAAGSGQGMPATIADWAEAILCNGHGRYDDALEAARRATAAPGDLFASMWALPELIEACSRVDDAAAPAHDALDRLVATTRAAGTDYGLGMEARCRALLDQGDTAEARYAEALERLSRTKVGTEVARTQLLHGEWLRRHGRRKDAREQLRTAHRAFSAMGMVAFAERARRELLATGETVRRRTPGSHDRLTPQEAQIAGLARDRLTNPEIAARLFLSPLTVEWHLKRVFAKLGISSRRDLGRVLPAATADE